MYPYDHTQPTTVPVGVEQIFEVLERPLVDFHDVRPGLGQARAPQHGQSKVVTGQTVSGTGHGVLVLLGAEVHAPQHLQVAGVCRGTNSI